MARPPAQFELFKLYKGKVEIKYFPKSHAYKIYDAENGRNWEKSPSVTGLTGNMDKGAGLMMYAMSEAMKYMDRQFINTSLKKAIEDPNFSMKELFKSARGAHISKSDLGKRVGTTSHDYVEQTLKNLIKAQKAGTQFIVPEPPKAMDLRADLGESWANILELYVDRFDKIENVDKFRDIISKDIEMRGLVWQETQMVEKATTAARDFFVSAVKQGAIKVWDVERLVHSRKHFYSGRFDSVLEFVKPFTWRGYTIPIGIYITDFKTSNAAVDYPMGIFPNYLPQLGLYDVAYCEEFPSMRDRVKGHLILGSSKHGDGFHPYVSLDRERNRKWGELLAPLHEFIYMGEKELKHLDLYGGKK